MVQIRWSRRVIAEIHEAREYLQPYSVAFAERFTDAIFAQGTLLEQQPLLGRVVPEAERQDIRELLFKKHRLVYQVVSTSEILILTLHPMLRPLMPESIFE